MIYGRPIGIPHIRTVATAGSLPQAVDDQYITAGQAQPEGVPSVNAFFASSVSLYRVMDEIFERLQEGLVAVRPDPTCQFHSDKRLDNYPGPTGCSCNAVPQLTTLLQLDGLLLKWHDNLPTYLKFPMDGVDQPNDDSSELQRQRAILKIRFLGLRILLHRQTILFLLQPQASRNWPRNASKRWPPLFSDDVGGSTALRCEASGRPNPYSSLETQLAHLSVRMCVDSAQLQIEMIDHYRAFNVIVAWWWDFNCE